MFHCLSPFGLGIQQLSPGPVHRFMLVRYLRLRCRNRRCEFLAESSLTFGFGGWNWSPPGGRV